MSSGAVDSRLVALLVIIVLGCQVSGMEAEDLCQQFKSGRATIALLTYTHSGKILLLDDHFRGYLVPKDHYYIESGIGPAWLNLTAQSPIQVDVGQETPLPINGRGVFYFDKRNAMGRHDAYLGVLWSNLTTVTIVPFDPPGPATIRNCHQDDYIAARVIPNIFFIRTYLDTELFRPSFTRDSLHEVVLGRSLSERSVEFYQISRASLSPCNLISIDGGFTGNWGSYGFSNCAKAIFNFGFNHNLVNFDLKDEDKKKRLALRLADFILCSATDQPPTSYSPEAEIVPAKCYHPEAEPTAIPTTAATTEDRVLIMLFSVAVVAVILVLCIACILCTTCCQAKPVCNSRGNSPTTSPTFPRTKSGGGGNGVKSFGTFWAKRN